MSREAGNRQSEGADAVEAVRLRLVVSEANLGSFQPVLRRVSSLGVEFTTLAEEQQRPGEWLSRFCDLDNSTRSHDPQVPRTVEQMRDRLAWLEFTPESCLLATLGDKYVGYTYLDPRHSTEGVLVQGWTGVRPEYRRQGIATALKVHAISMARRLGYAEIVTTLRIGNVSSITMNEKVGFKVELWQPPV